MERKRPENSAQFKPHKESILICSVALWLENKGLSKVLKRFISATQIQDGDWKARALNLNEIFFNYLDSCDDAHKDNTEKKLELDAASAEQTEVPKGKQKNLLSVASNGKHDSEVIVETKDKKKKKKMKRDDLVADDMNCELGINNEVFSDKNSSGLEFKHLKAQAKEMNRKKEASIFVELPAPGAEALGSEKPSDNISKKKSVEAAGDVVNESKKSSKKRKGLDTDENDVTVEEPKRRKTNDVKPQITLPGANGHADSQNKENFQFGRVRSQNFSGNQTGEILNNDPNNGAEKLSHPKSARKQHKSSAEPKTVNAFQRVKIEEVEFVDERLQDNSYYAKDGAENGYGAKAQEILGQVKGRGFRHEKTKKKRGSYRGGQIDLDSHSIKFNYSDDD